MHLSAMELQMQVLGIYFRLTVWYPVSMDINDLILRDREEKLRKQERQNILYRAYLFLAKYRQKLPSSYFYKLSFGKKREQEGTDLDKCKAVPHLWCITKKIWIRTPPSTTWNLNNLLQYEPSFKGQGRCKIWKERREGERVPLSQWLNSI